MQLWRNPVDVGGKPLRMAGTVVAHPIAVDQSRNRRPAGARIVAGTARTRHHEPSAASVR